MAKLVNPKFVGPVLAKVNARKAAVDNYLTANAALAEISFEKIRADNPGIAGDLTDDVLRELCRSLAIEVRE